MNITSTTRELRAPRSSLLHQWRSPAGRIFDLACAGSFISGFYARVGIDPAAVQGLFWLTFFFAVMVWLSRDAKRHPRAAADYGGVGLYVLWPVLLPFYLAQSRGWRQALRPFIVFMLAWVISSQAGWTVAALLER